jgi:hypothetical protein
MRAIFRIVTTFIGAIATFYFSFWTGGAALFVTGWLIWISFAMAAVAGIAVGRFIWVRTNSVRLGLARSALLGALVTGGVTFSAGFFGPILFASGSSQGPLLGLFITGPLGFLLGAVGGAIYWFARDVEGKRSMPTRHEGRG